MIIEEISINSNDYPEQLKNIYDPPLKLYVLGNKEILKQKGIAIVGARKATEYGKRVAFQISKELSKKEINIISVLGSGIDEIYPKENTELARKIIMSGGCIVSEYPCGTKPEKMNFPRRNRIISGLSNGILVVEASKTSGALITVDFGLEQGKEIFAVPGNIISQMSEGCNELIKEGAKIVLSSNDILEEFNRK